MEGVSGDDMNPLLRSVEKYSATVNGLIQILFAASSGQAVTLGGLAVMNAIANFRGMANLGALERKVEFLKKHQERISGVLAEKEPSDFSDPVVAQFYSFLDRLLHEEEDAKGVLYMNLFINLAEDGFQNKYRARFYNDGIDSLSIPGILWLLTLDDGTCPPHNIGSTEKHDDGSYPLDSFLSLFDAGRVSEPDYISSCHAGYVRSTTSDLRQLLNIDEARIINLKFGKGIRLMDGTSQKLCSLSEIGRDFCRMIR